MSTTITAITTLLLANCLAQTEALMRGRTLAEATRRAEGAGHERARRRARSRRTRSSPATGRRTRILYRRLDPAHARQAHRALRAQGLRRRASIWGINSFDQWGVELGKELATGLLPLVEGKAPAIDRDVSTLGLIDAIRLLRTM